MKSEFLNSEINMSPLNTVVVTFFVIHLDLELHPAMSLPAEVQLVQQVQPVVLQLVQLVQPVLKLNHFRIPLL